MIVVLCPVLRMTQLSFEFPPNESPVCPPCHMTTFLERLIQERDALRAHIVEQARLEELRRLLPAMPCVVAFPIGPDDGLDFDPPR